MTPEALDGGGIGKIRDGDMVRLDAEAGTLDVLLTHGELAARTTPIVDLSDNAHGFGRELFEGFRRIATRADHGATAFG